ncbi:SPOR domain-containing protein [Shewanella sp. 0m-8]
MSSQFQNRLVGVIVIVALGVIFLPDILDGKKQREEEQFAEIPLRPEIQESHLPEQNIETVDLGQNTQQAAQDTGSSGDASWHIAEEDEPVKAVVAKAKAQVKTTPKLESNSTAKPKAAWTIQLGSFNNAANVKGLVNRLRDKGFTAYTLPTKPIDGQLTKVFVGPNVSKDKLNHMQRDIEKLTQLKGRVVAYNPVEK